MNIIYILIPLSVVLMAIAIYFFFWAVKNDQFDDLDTPALDILDDDEKPAKDSAQDHGDHGSTAEKQKNL